MPTYDYECRGCGHRFERRQAITEPALEACPDCGAEVRRVVSGGSGFIVRGRGGAHGRDAGPCSLETTGRTCCGQVEPCGAGCGDGR
jgi:putative FmdB family regulatory protein